MKVFLDEFFLVATVFGQLCCLAAVGQFFGWWAGWVVGARRGGGSKGWGAQISRFFFTLPPEISFFLLSLVELWWCLKHWCPEMCAFGVVGLPCEAPAAPKKAKIWAVRRRGGPAERPTKHFEHTQNLETHTHSQNTKNTNSGQMRFGQMRSTENDLVKFGFSKTVFSPNLDESALNWDLGAGDVTFSLDDTRKSHPPRWCSPTQGRAHEVKGIALMGQKKRKRDKISKQLSDKMKKLHPGQEEKHKREDIWDKMKNDKRNKKKHGSEWTIMSKKA